MKKIEIIERINYIKSLLPRLTEGQTYWIAKIIKVLNEKASFNVVKSDLFNTKLLNDFGDALRIHHCFSGEPFSKDKFEYVLESIFQLNGQDAKLAPKGNPGYDILIDKSKISLKTQADKSIKQNFIWISKFMELGKGDWSDDPKDLIALRNLFLNHLKNYDRIFTLRTLSKAPNWYYELVEIPKSILAQAKGGELKMMLESPQMPKPGYCYVKSKAQKNIFELYFDGGGERKLQVRKLDKSFCVVHAIWQFTIPEV